jgi:hypothetical protein
MNKLIPIAAAVATAISMAPAQARTMQAHDRLVTAVRNVGVSIHLNPQECIGASFDGYYRSAASRMVICQDNGIAGSNRQASWTANDLDTLRHESHHVVQDCIGLIRGNNELGTIYAKPFVFAQRYFGTITIENILATYKGLGASPQVQVLEVEAFAVAEMNNPDEQVADLRRYCL